eukprot:TRINITY_DN4795_c0_g2_i3.p1 TRINITY_DN4795_c0_g2~~TRINITY_DN4795_c0_g2_i3.p1  ORF type:complete len:1663 (-),score=388.40 TRINITY_DN4795_c0_g2_i3:785-5773(-)
MKKFFGLKKSKGDGSAQSESNPSASKKDKSSKTKQRSASSPAIPGSYQQQPSMSATPYPGLVDHATSSTTPYISTSTTATTSTSTTAATAATTATAPKVTSTTNTSTATAKPHPSPSQIPRLITTNRPDAAPRPTQSVSLSIGNSHSLGSGENEQYISALEHNPNTNISAQTTSHSVIDPSKDAQKQNVLHAAEFDNSDDEFESTDSDDDKIRSVSQPARKSFQREKSAVDDEDEDEDEDGKDYVYTQGFPQSNPSLPRRLDMDDDFEFDVIDDLPINQTRTSSIAVDTTGVKRLEFMPNTNNMAAEKSDQASNKALAHETASIYPAIDFSNSEVALELIALVPNSHNLLEFRNFLVDASAKQRMDYISNHCIEVLIHIANEYQSKSVGDASDIVNVCMGCFKILALSSSSINGLPGVSLLLAFLLTNLADPKFPQAQLLQLEALSQLFASSDAVRHISLMIDAGDSSLAQRLLGELALLLDTPNDEYHYPVFDIIGRILGSSPANNTLSQFLWRHPILGKILENEDLDAYGVMYPSLELLADTHRAKLDSQVQSPAGVALTDSCIQTTENDDLRQNPQVQCSDDDMALLLTMKPLLETWTSAKKMSVEKMCDFLRNDIMPHVVSYLKSSGVEGDDVGFIDFLEEPLAQQLQDLEEQVASLKGQLEKQTNLTKELESQSILQNVEVESANVKFASSQHELEEANTQIQELQRIVKDKEGALTVLHLELTKSKSLLDQGKTIEEAFLNLQEKHAEVMLVNQQLQQEVTILRSQNNELNEQLELQTYQLACDFTLQDQSCETDRVSCLDSQIQTDPDRELQELQKAVDEKAAQVLNLMKDIEEERATSIKQQTKSEQETLALNQALSLKEVEVSVLQSTIEKLSRDIHQYKGRIATLEDALNSPAPEETLVVLEFAEDTALDLKSPSKEQPEFAGDDDVEDQDPSENTLGGPISQVNAQNHQKAHTEDLNTLQSSNTDKEKTPPASPKRSPPSAAITEVKPSWSRLSVEIPPLHQRQPSLEQSAEQLSPLRVLTRRDGSPKGILVKSPDARPSPKRLSVSFSPTLESSEPVNREVKKILFSGSRSGDEQVFVPDLKPRKQQSIVSALLPQTENKNISLSIPSGEIPSRGLSPSLYRESSIERRFSPANRRATVTENDAHRRPPLKTSRHIYLKNKFSSLLVDVIAIDSKRNSLGRLIDHNLNAQRKEGVLELLFIISDLVETYERETSRHQPPTISAIAMIKDENRNSSPKIMASTIPTKQNDLLEDKSAQNQQSRRLLTIPRPSFLSEDKAQGVASMIKMFSDVEAIKSALLMVEESFLTADLLRGILNILPTDAEMASIGAINFAEQRPSAEERFILELIQIPRIKTRIQSHLYKKDFHGLLGELKADCDQFCRACEEFNMNRKYHRILDMLAQVTATTHDQALAQAISLDSLAKLVQSLDTGGRWSADLLSECAASPHNLKISDQELELLQKAARIPLSSIEARYSELKVNLSMVEFEALNTELLSGDFFKEHMMLFVKKAKPRLERVKVRIAEAQEMMGSICRMMGTFFLSENAQHMFEIFAKFFGFVSKQMSAPNWREIFSNRSSDPSKEAYITHSQKFVRQIFLFSQTKATIKCKDSNFAFSLNIHVSIFKFGRVFPNNLAIQTNDIKGSKLLMECDV